MRMPIHPLKSSTAATRALVGIWSVVLGSFVLAGLFLARDLLVPVTLAALLTFLLAPLVTRLERWVGRIGAVLGVVMLILVATGAAGWVLTRQVVDLSTRLPDYQENLQSRLRSFQLWSDPRFAKVSGMMEELRKDLSRARTNTVGPGPGRPEPGTPPPMRVEVVEQPGRANPFGLAQALIAPVLGPIGRAALVFLLVVFMLLKREDLRSRLIRLIGQGRISATTRAMDDAGARVTRYLLMQSVLNAGYGTLVAIGLYFIGVPNAPLWGVSAAVLRFIPYVGPWIGAAAPIALSLAVSAGWTMPLLALGLFIGLELLSNNVLEPWLYGASTGVSPLALVLAAVGWTWLWGPVGLVLATPMTVCLVVMGRHIPGLSFLGVLLSSEDALTPAEDCYYRLLTVGERDEMEFVEAYVAARSLAALYDDVLLPVITAVEIDHRLERLDDGQREIVEQGLRDIVEDLGARAPTPSGNDVGTIVRPPAGRVYCLPARAERDELAGSMLVQLLRQQGVEAQVAPTKLGIETLTGLVEKAGVDAVCISVVTPSTVLHARYLCLRLRAALPGLKILVGLWGATEQLVDSTRRVRESGADVVVTSFAEAVRHFAEPAATPGAGDVPATVPVFVS